MTHSEWSTRVTGRWSQSEASFRRAIELNPNSSATRLNYVLLLLWPLRRIDAALQQLRQRRALRESTEIYTPQVLVHAPALFSLSGDGRGQGSIWNSVTGLIVSAANPATAGDALSM